MRRQGGRTARKSDWTSERVAGGTDDDHGDRHEQSNEASTERTATAPSYLPVRRVDEAGRKARSNWTAAAPGQIPMTGRSRGEARRERHAAKQSDEMMEQSVEAHGGYIKQAGARGETPDGTRGGTTRRIPHEPVISIISSGI